MKTNTLYKAVDKLDESLKFFLVTPNGVAVGEWDSNLSDATFAQVVKARAESEKGLSYEDITQYHARATKPLKISEW
jgi:hypothetical protein